MRRSSPLLLSITLVFACGYASAAGLQHLNVESSASCPDNTTTSSDRSELGDVDPSTPTVAPERRSEKAKTAVSPRSSVIRTTAPRWHSFLPGMFR